MNEQKYIKQIRTISDVSLWGSVAVVVLTALFHLVSDYRFYQSNSVARAMLVCGTVIAVAVVGYALLASRRNVPHLRQMTGLEAKLEGYAKHQSSIGFGILAGVLVICALTVLSAQNTLLMLAMVAVMVLFLTYPNMYRIKVDLGLTDDEMRRLFGDKYYGGNE